MALTNVIILTLSHSLLTNEDSEINGLKDCIIFGNELINEDGIPIQDYNIHP